MNIKTLIFLLLTVVLISIPQIGLCISFGRLPSPLGYRRGATLEINVNSLTSRKGLIPYNFYSIKTCHPDEQSMREGRVKENLGEILLGNRILPSLYDVEVGENTLCKTVCTVQYNEKEMSQLRKLINQYYRAHMFLEGLPLVEKPSPSVLRQKMRLGYRLGVPKRISGLEGTLVHNHLNFTIMYTPQGDDDVSITGFYVTPMSKLHPCVQVEQHETVSAESPNEIEYSYSVTWVADDEPSSITTRWDVYALTMRSATRKGHWMAIVNSIVLLAFLGILVGVALLRTVRKDLLVYTDPELVEEAQDESGWKLLRGDVFRAPPHAVIFSGIIGAGCQAILMSTAVMMATLVGILHPTQRGNLLTGLIMFFFLASGISGLTVGRMLKFFHKQSWKNGAIAVIFIPGLLFSGYIMCNLINWSKHASTAIPFGTLILVISLFIFVFMPLALVGLSTGFRHPAYEAPCKVGSIPRAIPQEISKRRWLYILGGGIIPFSAAFIEIVYILGAFWQGEPFYYFGYLAAILVIITFVCAEVAVVVTYALLVGEDYNWWWGSLVSGGSGGLFFFAYSLIYLFTALEIRQPLSMILYCLYTAGVSTILFTLTGAIGFFASAAFVKTIYGAIKAD